MANYIIIGGKTSQHMEKLFVSASDINIKYTFTTPTKMADTILEKGSAFLSDIEAILITDYGFSTSDFSKRYKEFIYLQDALNVNSIDTMEVNLYLATKDTDLYRELRNPTTSMPPFIYLFAEAYLIEGQNYPSKQLMDILRGAKQKRGLYNKEVDNINIDARIRESTEKFIEESKVYDANIVKMSKEEEKGSFTNLEFINSPESEAMMQKEKTDAKRREKELEREKIKEKRKKRTKQREDIGDEEETEKINIVFESRGRNNVVDIDTDVEIKRKQTAERKKPALRDEVDVEEEYSVGDEHYADIQKLRDSFLDLAFKNGYGVRGKLETDVGVIAVTSYGRNGASSLVSNFADIFALSNKKVLVVDLDTKKKTQTKQYFKTFDEEAKNHYGVEDGLIKVVNGGALQREVVEITSRVSVLGLSPKIKVSKEDTEKIIANIDFVLEDAKSIYDIVLVDIPEHIYQDVFPKITDILDKNLFIVDNNFENLQYFVDDYLNGLESEDEMMFEDIASKSEVIINKYNKQHLDDNGKESGTKQLTNMLYATGFPYDSIKVAGELPYFENWDTQFLESLRYIWINERAMGMYRYILSKVVI